MPTNLTVNGVVYAYPNPGDQQWGAAATNWAIAITSGTLQKAGGAFTLTADVNFGGSFGLISQYFTSRSSNPAAAGILRLANTDTIGFRNAANNADIALGCSASNQLTWNGNVIASSAGVVPVASGGTGLTAGTSGGILGYTATGTLASSALLAQYGVMIGGGAGATPTALTPNASVAFPLVSGGAAANPSWALLSVAGGGTGSATVVTAPAATAWAGWDVNKNLSANSHIPGYTTVATAAGTTTLVVGSTALQYFTGATTQTVVLPATNTLVTGQQFIISNLSSGVVTVQSSGANTIQAMAANTQLVVTCISTSGTGTASWSWAYLPGTQSAVLPAGLFPALTGDVTTTAGALATSLVGIYALAHLSGNITPGTSQLNFATVDADSNSAVTTGASWKFTVPSAGKYAVSFTGILTSAAVGGTLGIYKNGSLARYIATTNTTNMIAGMSVLSFAANDTIDLRCNTTGTTWDSTAGYTSISIWKVGT